MSNQQVSQKVSELYNTVSYSAYGADYFPVVKSLGLSKDEFALFAKGKNALEVGCGGGQLTAFLSNSFSQVTAVDISSKSLELARQECLKRGISNTQFIEANLFDDSFINQNAASFDFVLCYGVLHHTASPAEGFIRLTKLLKPGGFLVIGLYSRTELLYRVKRKIVLLLAGEDWKKRESWAKRLWFGGKENKVSIFDGYVHPQVSFHSVKEISSWVKKSKLQYISSWPHFELKWYWKKLLGKNDNENKFGSLNYSHLLFLIVELIWILSGKSVMVSVAVKRKI